MTQHKIIGIDLAKIIFFLFEINHKGKTLGRKKLQRSQLLSHIANQLPCTIAMEACSSAHYWAREFSQFGHKVLLYPPQHVKAQRRKQKMIIMMLKPSPKWLFIKESTRFNQNRLNNRISNPLFACVDFLSRKELD